MADFLNLILFELNQFMYLVEFEFQTREITAWLFFFMPILVFGEFPRYVFPFIFLMFAKMFSVVRSDEGKQKAFFATQPSVTVLLVGYNEEPSVANAIKSLLELDYDNLEIIVIDDNSEDRMYQEAKPFADQGLIKLYKNTAATGRAGRPTSSNMAFFLSKGDFIVSVDADTSFDRDMLYYMIGPFYDPKVGGVAGNIKVRNLHASIWTRFQSIEYTFSITMWKRWLQIIGMGMQVSGAFGSFRREALTSYGAWDPELAEDADMTLKVKKIGWKVVFAPYAIAMTNAPDTWKVLKGQRFRWDKGAFRTYFRKHVDIMNIRVFNWRNAFELSLEYLFVVVLTLMYPIYLAVMLYLHPALLIFALVISYVVYVFIAFISYMSSLLYSERPAEEATLIPTLLLFPMYKSLFRWVRVAALIMEMLRINYEEGYLPSSAWRNQRKW